MLECLAVHDDDLQQILIGVLGQSAQAHVVDNEQVGFDILLERAVPPVERILGENVAHEIEDGAGAAVRPLLIAS